VFDASSGPEVEARLRTSSTRNSLPRFGEPIDDAYSDPAGLGHLTIGWVFPVPDFFEIPGPRDDFEVVVIPMLWDPDEAGPTEALFVNLARQRQEFEALRRDGAVDKLVVVDLHQRAPDEPPDVLAREFPAPPAS
jgi:hypothetical protein